MSVGLEKSVSILVDFELRVRGFVSSDKIIDYLVSKVLAGFYSFRLIYDVSGCIIEIIDLDWS
jgi:hypothetical protein